MTLFETIESFLVILFDEKLLKDLLSWMKANVEADIAGNEIIENFKSIKWFFDMIIVIL